MSWKCEVLASGETKFVSNGQRFATEEEAKEAGNELAGRWFAVKEWRAVEADEPVNYRFDFAAYRCVRLEDES